ncbi:MAG TPA: DUF2167 domain-containing protein, partial [Cellvibrionaceae bacterium]|nr:DUF2167 domain-containing protein [Cellvibrionaceae bacterium]
LNPQAGLINLPGGVATLNLPAQFSYLTPAATERLLVEGWGNPPGTKTLGMVIPTEVNPVEAGGWGVVITYEADGHISDADADEINYTDLLKDMQEDNAAANQERIKEGYGSMLLIGWAEAPHYDKSSHKFYWAKEFKTDQPGANSLNYNIRVLGRSGVLVLNAVASMEEMPVIRAQMPSLLTATEFVQGNRYEDFNANTDHVAEYGLAALVAGGAAAKLGLFAKLAALFIAFKKLIIIGAVAVGGFIMKLLGRKQK